MILYINKWLIELLVFILPMFMFFSTEVLIVYSSLMFFLFYLEWGFLKWSYFFFIDDLSLMMNMMSILVFLILFIIVWENCKKYFLFITFFIILLFFFSESLFLFLVLFELSLVPIMMMVYLYGSQKERMSAGVSLLMYTLIASVPFVLMVVYLTSTLKLKSIGMFWKFGELDIFYNSSSLIYIMMVLSFLVKIPSFGLHMWLPKAHVEASLEGSMLLAGIMLKMGAYGLIRFMYLMKSFYSTHLCSFMSVVFLVGSILSTLLLVSSQDLKVIVAYSSVSHMNFMMVILFVSKNLSLCSVFMTLFSHSLVSVGLFYLVTEIYNKTHSRSVLVNRGVLVLFKSISVISVIMWSVNLSLPPSFSFVGEIVGFSSFLSMSYLLIPIVILFVILSSYYSIYMYCILSRSRVDFTFKLLSFDLNFISLTSFLMIIQVSLFFMMDFLVN